MHGFKHLTSFQNPRAAVEFYRTHRPDLVLLDYQMPELSGIEVLTLFKQIGHYPPPPVMALTAVNCQQTRLKFLSLGAKDFLNKPFDNDEFIYRVKKLLLMHLGHKESLQHNNTLDVLVEKQ
jgi:putative two-component system response regulator